MWQPVNFTPPPAIADLADGLAGSLAGLESTLQSGSGGLAGLGLPSLPSLPDVAGPLRAGASEMLASPAKFMAITPFQHGIGERVGENAYLTPADAIKTALTRSNDIAGVIKADNFGKSALAFVLIAAPEPGQLAESLRAFNAVYPVKELQKAERRAGALATLEIDKFVIPDAPAFPAWLDAAPLNNAKGQAMNAAAGAQLAFAEGMQAATKAPQAALAEFSAKVQQKAKAAQERLSELASGMMGENPGWFGLYLEGPIVDLLRFAADYPGNNVVQMFGIDGNVHKGSLLFEISIFR